MSDSDKFNLTTADMQFVVERKSPPEEILGPGYRAQVRALAALAAPLDTSRSASSLLSPAPGPKHPKQGNSLRRMASGFHEAGRRLRAFFFFGRGSKPAPLRRRLLLLLDPPEFALWWPRLRDQGSTFLQKLARVWVIFFPPPYPTLQEPGTSLESAVPPEQSAGQIPQGSWGQSVVQIKLSPGLKIRRVHSQDGQTLSLQIFEDKPKGGSR